MFGFSNRQVEHICEHALYKNRLQREQREGGVGLRSTGLYVSLSIYTDISLVRAYRGAFRIGVSDTLKLFERQVSPR